MVDVKGLALDQEERTFLSHQAVGGVILFSRNYQSKKQVAALTEEIKSIRQPSLLIAVDQEGGRVQRFRDQFYPLPPLYHLGRYQRSNPRHANEIAFAAGRLMAAELIQVGVDFSFAPVLDLANPDSTVIGKRGIDSDPERIATLGKQYILGMNSAGMQATGKHFPGHGSVVADSHFKTPMDERSLDTMMESDLVPYLRLRTHLAAVMTAHIWYPNVDAELPTFSSFWIAQVLRQQIVFQGIIFSDDLTMQGAGAIAAPLERAQKALTAGCNMALICNAPAVARLVADALNPQFIPGSPILDKIVARKRSIEPAEIDQLCSALNALHSIPDRQPGETSDQGFS